MTDISTAAQVQNQMAEVGATVAHRLGHALPPFPDRFIYPIFRSAVFGIRDSMLASEPARQVLHNHLVIRG